MYSYDYPMFSLAVDIVVYSTKGFLLIKRKNEPFKDCWSFPGGFVNIDEVCIDAAIRELSEETNLVCKKERFILVSILDKVDRDPRGRTVAMCYFLYLNDNEIDDVVASDDAIEFMWDKHPTDLAFDHNELCLNCEECLHDLVNESFFSGRQK